MNKRIAIAAVAALLAFAACGDGTTVTLVPGDATTTTAAATTTTAAPTATTEAPTTTVAETTTTEAPTTTTTEAAAVVTLTDEGIQAGDTWLWFGYDDDDAVTAVAAVLGPPDSDSGWVDSFSAFGTCPPPVVRGVTWGGLTLLFTKADTDFWFGGVEHFWAYYYTSVPPALETTDGLAIGDTIADLQAIYGGPKLQILEDPFDPTAAIWKYDEASWTGMWGFADSQNPSGVISSINGGRGCGE